MESAFVDNIQYSYLLGSFALDLTYLRTAQATVRPLLADLGDDDSHQRDGDGELTADEADEKHVVRLNHRPHTVTDIHSSHASTGARNAAARRVRPRGKWRKGTKSKNGHKGNSVDRSNPPEQPPRSSPPSLLHFYLSYIATSMLVSIFGHWNRLYDQNTQIITEVDVKLNKWHIAMKTHWNRTNFKKYDPTVGLNHAPKTQQATAFPTS